ncbi:unnamed protein product [Sphagnum balticum]
MGTKAGIGAYGIAYIVIRLSSQRWVFLDPILDVPAPLNTDTKQNGSSHHLPLASGPPYECKPLGHDTFTENNKPDATNARKALGSIGRS